MKSFEPVLLILVGLLVGWLAGRTVPLKSTVPPRAEGPLACSLGETPAKNDNHLTSEAAAPPAAAVKSHGEAIKSAPLADQLSQLKIVELRRICDEAENKFLTQRISNYAPALNDMSKNEHDQELEGLRRQFATVVDRGSYWRLDFTIEAQHDVIYAEVMLDLESNSESDFKCVAWSFYYELNGVPQKTSLFGASACEGSGIRKRGDTFYVDVATYNFAGIGKRVTNILLPLPLSSGSIEYLPSDQGEWQTLGGKSWSAVSRADYLAWQRKITDKVGAGP